MTTSELMNILNGLYSALCEHLTESSDYVSMDSCNVDLTRYCVPKGCESEVTYTGKPEKSIRISDHWSWYSNIHKCRDAEYIQCYNLDVPFPRQRQAAGKASFPRKAAAIAVFLNGAYHTVAGSVYNTEDDAWSVIIPSESDLISAVDELIL